MASRELGRAYGVSKSTIVRRLAEAGYPLRPGNAGPRLEGRWSIKGWRACRACGTTEKRHKALGLCTTHYSIQYCREYRKRQKAKEGP